jgi:hypothetical protein
MKKQKTSARTQKARSLHAVVSGVVWEYIISTKYFYHADTQAELNRLGKDGWEAVGMLTDGACLLKRQAANGKLTHGGIIERKP